MIRFSDAFILAYTKLRVHRIRTGVAVGVSGLLFGLIATVIIIAQGVFSSVESFSDVGLNNRTILNVSYSSGGIGFNEYDNRDDPAFIQEVEAAHKDLITKKTAAAKKYNIAYEPAIEDPSPIMLDAQTKAKTIKDSALGSELVQELASARRIADYKPFDINGYIAGYSSASVIQSFRPIEPSAGALVYMKDGKESRKGQEQNIGMYGNEAPSLTVVDSSISKPFVSNTSFDPTKGEIPVIVPYDSAEKLLGLKKLNGKATMQERYDRLQEVRDRIGEVTVTYCYRNEASQSLLASAIAQQEEIKLGTATKEYVKPAVIYSVPDEKVCGAVAIASDTRTAAQKKQDANQVLYEKEIGMYEGDPEQQLVTVRGVGITSELGTTGQWAVSDMVQSLFSSWLGFGTWTVPADMLAQLPQESRPQSIFESNETLSIAAASFGFESYLVEFSDKEQARELLRASGMFGASGSNSSSIFVSPYGSGVLVVDELKTMFVTVLMWMFAIVGGIAVIILASIIGRTVSEGRRESSIFRAIGASRLDIGSIYGTYVLLLALRVMLFAAVLGIGIALVVEILFWQDATLGAKLAYASADISKEFHLFSLASPYLLWIAGVILVASVLASIVPILLGARRNPIKDMRNDT